MVTGRTECRACGEPLDIIDYGIIEKGDDCEECEGVFCDKCLTVVDVGGLDRIVCEKCKERIKERMNREFEITDTEQGEQGE